MGAFQYKGAILKEYKNSRYKNQIMTDLLIFTTWKSL